VTFCPLEPGSFTLERTIQFSGYEGKFELALNGSALEASQPRP
jgi:predicted heme/steroid binding protein